VPKLTKKLEAKGLLTLQEKMDFAASGIDGGPKGGSFG
jgi:hypothetical protein